MEVKLSNLEQEMVRQGRNRDAFESMLSRFNRMVQNSGLFSELKKHEFYEKPSVDRHRRKIRKQILSRRSQDKRE